MEWNYDCGGDRVLDERGFVRFYAVAWPEGTAHATLYVGDMSVAEFGDYGKPLGSQVQAMAAVEQWVEAKSIEVRKLLTAMVTIPQ